MKSPLINYIFLCRNRKLRSSMFLWSVVLLCLIVSVGCAKKDNDSSHEIQEEAVRYDTWYVRPVNGDYDRWQLLDRSRLHAVLPTMMDEALKMVDKVPITKVTTEKAHELGGGLARANSSGELFVIRALSFNPWGKFYVYVMKDQLWLENGTLGRSARMQRSALIVQLDRQPTHVFVTCSVAE